MVEPKAEFPETVKKSEALYAPQKFAAGCRLKAVITEDSLAKR